MAVGLLLIEVMFVLDDGDDHEGCQCGNDGKAQHLRGKACLVHVDKL